MSDWKKKRRLAAKARAAIKGTEAHCRISIQKKIPDTRKPH